MKKLLIIILLGGLAAVASLPGCKPDPSIDIAAPDTSLNISFTLPDGWPQPAYTFTNNTLTQAGFELGRKLFYDTRLSKDNTISCGSCHQQFAAFAHLDHNVSHGIHDLLGTRNTPALFNMAWQSSFFWDGGVTNIENQPINPMQNPVEMDQPVTEAITKLSADEQYRSMFNTAFGSDTINSQRIFKALAQFMAAMVSDNSKYDKYIRGESGGELTAQELSGLSLFRLKCGNCHPEPLFTDDKFHNDGLTLDPTFNDTGRIRITGNTQDRYKFKVPSLRNVARSAPYMHDGRFSTLDAVLEHYRSGIYVWHNADPLLRQNIGMSEQDKADIIAFLNTLTDETFLHDLRFSEQ